jgi:hypothetical protein
MTIRNKKYLIVLLAFLMLSGCATHEAIPPDKLPGFFTGLWHGFIIIYSVIAHLFNENIRIYSTYNNGGWYDFGFFIGICVFFS